MLKWFVISLESHCGRLSISWIERLCEGLWLVAINGTDFKNGKTIQITDGNPDGEPERKTAELNGLNENCRYVHIQAINRGVCPDWHDGAGGKAWVFADEIIVEWIILI